MNMLFTLCGRAGSKGLRSKNILPFCNIPLPYYSLAAIHQFQKRHAHNHARMDVVLSTDSAELKQLIQTVDEKVFLIDREAALAGDAIRKIDVIRDAARRSSKHFGMEYDMVIDLDLTSPLRTLQDLEHVVEKRNSVDADVVYTVTPARRNPYFNQVMRQENGYFSTVCEGDFATRQQAPDIYDMNASIYAYTPSFIAGTELRFHKADIVVMKDTGILDIDGPEDYELMQVIAAWLFEHDPAYKTVYQEAKSMYKGQKNVL